MSVVRGVLVSLGLAGSALGQVQPEQVLRLDVVRLVAGEEIQGREDLVAQHEFVAYHFVNEESQAAFEAEPEKYAVVDGGACGSMGPLAGLGDAERYAVHEGRVYFFASDGCRARFLAEPGRCIETDNPVPTPTELTAARGRAALAKTVAWAGGREAIAGMDSIRFVATRKETHSEKEWTIVNEVAVDFPDRYMAAEQWNNLRYTTVSTPEGGAMGGMAGIDRIAASREHAFGRLMAREVPVLLHAFASGRAEGDGAAMVVESLGESETLGRRVERVRVALNGATSVLALDFESGEPVAMDFVGRDGTSSVGEVRRAYTRFETVDGVTMPVAYTVTVDGKPVKGAARDFAVLEIDPELDEGVFAISE